MYPNRKTRYFQTWGMVIVHRRLTCTTTWGIRLAVVDEDKIIVGYTEKPSHIEYIKMRRVSD